MRNRFDSQLKTLNDNMITMGALCETAIAKAIKALKNNDAKLAKEAIEDDSEVDQMESDIERMCLRLLLQQQPVAKDLRQISSALKMITDMERIGDQASDIAEIVTTSDLRDEIHNSHIDRMAQATIGMVSMAIDAYVKRDLDIAQNVFDSDDTVDELFIKIRNDLIEQVQISKNPVQGEHIMDILMIAKYLERIGDHATNIAGWVRFAVTGQHGKTAL
jgi:phosphate transport system protein